MVAEFRRKFNDFFLPPGRTGRTDKSQMVRIYSNSIFVLNGRGNKNLLCFRVFEAIMNGAIPVVIGRAHGEGNISYFMGGIADGHERMPATVNLDSLPWVIGETWRDAAERVEKLLENPSEIDELQKKMMIWWDELIRNLRNYIYYALKRRWMEAGRDPSVVE